jgi:serine protease Do
MADFDNMDHDNNDDSRKNGVYPGESGDAKQQSGYDFWAENPQGASSSSDSTDANALKKRWFKNKYVKFVGLALGFGIIASISFLGVQKIYFMMNPSAKQDSVLLNLSSQNYNIKRTSMGSVKTQPKSVITDVIANTKPAIVAIDCLSTETDSWFGQQFKQQVKGSGSGIIVAKNDDELLIATNNHVVAGAAKIKVTFIDGTKSEAIVKGTDTVADLAVITVDISKMKEGTLKKVKVATLGNSDKVKVGEMAIAIGNALGYGQSTTVGYISARNRTVEVNDGTASKKMVLLQTDAAINPGNSGGALLNVEGEVIGINTVKYASDEVEGMGYAIPITRANPIIKELMSRKIVKKSDQGYLGILGGDVTEDVSKNLKIPVGVFVNKVEKDSGAKKAGIIKGDIITAANGVEITSITQLHDYVTSFAAGTKIEITLMRGKNGAYKKQKVTVTLTKKPKNASTEESGDNSIHQDQKNPSDGDQSGSGEGDDSQGTIINPFGDPLP